MAIAALSLLAIGLAEAAPATATAATTSVTAQRPFNPPPGGAVITTYYSDASHTQVVGQYLSSPCQAADWGVRTSFYTVGFTSCS